jgi:hypothetical protein
MNPVGKPDAGNPHVRFDERGRETEPLAKRLTATAPFLDSTMNCLDPRLSQSRKNVNCSVGKRVRFKAMRGRSGPD